MPINSTLLLGHHGPGAMCEKITNCTPTCTKTNGFIVIKMCIIRFTAAKNWKVVFGVVVNKVTHIIDITN